MENWAVVAGRYARKTGLDMRQLPIHMLYDIAFSEAQDAVLRTKEEHEALEKLDSTIRNQADIMDGDIPDWMKAFEVQRGPMPIAG